MKTMTARLRKTTFSALMTASVFGILSTGALLTGCAHAPTAAPYDAVVVDRSSPDKVVITLSGVSCEQPKVSSVNASSLRDPAQSDHEKMAFPFTTEDGTTYYFGSDSDRTRFIQAHDINSRY